MPILALLLIFLASCAEKEPQNEEIPTKYPEIPPYSIIYEIEAQSRTK